MLTLHTMRQASEITFQTIRNNTSGKNRVLRVQGSYSPVWLGVGPARLDGMVVTFGRPSTI